MTESTPEDMTLRNAAARSPLSPEQLGALLAPLNSNRIASRRQSGRNLSYLEAYDVKATLTRVFGFGGFSAETIESQVLRMEQDVPAWEGSRDNRRRKTDDEGNPAFNWSVTAKCVVRLTIPVLGAVFTEAAAASQTGPDVGEVTDFAIKTAESDALKRAAIYLGTQFGLSLYNDGATADVVRTVLEPAQAAALQVYRDESAARHAASLNAQQAQIDRALGGGR